MKIALYIEDGLEQIVLTPDSETEKSILDKIHDGTRELRIARGSFYGCRGGWTRWKDQPRHSVYGSEINDESTMIVLAKPAAAPAPHSPEDCDGQ
jgi:hypothetical protein